MEDIFSEVLIDEVVVPDPGDADFLSELVGEGKKFKDHAALAKGKKHADMTIDVLTKKLDDLKKELTSRSSVQELLDQIKAQTKTQEQTPPAAATPPDADGKELDDSTLEAKLEALLSKKQALNSAKSNAEAVTAELRAQFGANAQAVLNDKARELGLSVKELQDIAMKSPAAFFRTTGVTPGETFQAGVAAPKSSVTTQVGTGVTVRNAKYYERMKLTDPKQYFNEKTTVQMMRDFAALGEAYNN